MLHQKYIKSIVESCNKDQNYVVMLHWDAIDEVHEKISQKCEFVRKLGNIIEKYKYKSTSISFHKTGKILFTNVKRIDTLLKELLE
ncbi:MAG: hypothetical protein ACW96U_05695 [Candidatus Heimdallarchaeaceae archaeon]